MKHFLDSCPREARLIVSGSSCHIVHGIESGTIATVIHTYEGLLYTLELPSGKLYQYWPEEVRPM